MIPHHFICGSSLGDRAGVVSYPPMMARSAVARDVHGHSLENYVDPSLDVLTPAAGLDR